MKSLSYIRFATYGLFIASALVAKHDDMVIPVHILSYRHSLILRAKEDAARAAAAIPKQRDFRDTRMSGSQVMAAAIAAMKKGGTNLDDYGEPLVDLSNAHGRLVWTVAFFQLGGGTDSFFDVMVDDQTGATKVGGAP